MGIINVRYENLEQLSAELGNLEVQFGLDMAAFIKVNLRFAEGGFTGQAGEYAHDLRIKADWRLAGSMSSTARKARELIEKTAESMKQTDQDLLNRIANL